MTDAVLARPRASEGGAFPNLLSSIRIGPVELRNRLMVPPHGGRIGNLWGSDEDAARNVAYWAARAEAGVGWLCGVTAHLGNRLIPGFEPTGVGAQTAGVIAQPYFVDRVSAYAEAVRAAGAAASVQLVKQGGTPHGPSSAMSAPIYNVVPHVLSAGEIAGVIDEFRFAAAQVAKTGANGIELHLNHDDLLEWFISPATNRRTDAYGGSLENRLRLPRQVLEAVRDEVGSEVMVGVRINLYQDIPGGYDTAAGIAHAQFLEATGLIDYLNVVIGTAWGNPSYIQPHFFAAGQWAEAVGELRRGVRLPVVHAGRITSPEVAEAILAAGHADVVGMARAHIADPEVLRKAAEGRTDEIRPCVGCNECISRHYVEELPFACAVNPAVGREVEGPLPRAAVSRRVLVIGGGPAGMELAGTAAERGHQVSLWEAGAELGGQLRLATAAPGYDDFVRYLRWHEGRLKRAGVVVELGRRATAEDVRAAAPDVVVVATGATPRIPAIPGADRSFVHEVRDVLAGRQLDGEHVVVIAGDDHMAPLSAADLLSDRGHRVTVLYAGVTPAPLLSRYMIGTILGRLDAKGVTVRCTADVHEIGQGCVVIRHTFSGRLETISHVAAVVLACGGLADDSLFTALQDEVPEGHVLGDAYAPRRLVHATRQAHALALTL